MKNVNIILAIILLMMTGCERNRQAKQTGDFITVNVTASYPQKELILQDFIDVEYIALETVSEFYTQGIVQAIGKEMIIVTNQVRDGDIFIFDRNGKGLRKINRMGRGPEEYTGLHEIILDEENGEIFINDYPAKKIMVYDLYGNFNRSFHFKKDARYRNIYNFDRSSLICVFDDFVLDGVKDDNPIFVIVSKQDGNIIKNIHIAYEQRKSPIMRVVNENGINISFIRNFPLIPYHDSWVLTEVSSDTVFMFLPDYGMVPFMTRTPPIQSMSVEMFLVPLILTERYHFLQTVKKEYNFTTWQGFPVVNLVYDRQGKTIYECTVYNDDYSDKRPVNMVQRTINNEVAFFQKIEADELVEDYEKGVLKGRLKEIAAKLKEEANPVIMLVKYKK